jgi:hypothetical protein
MSTKLYSYSYTINPHFLFKQRQFNIGILFIEGRDNLHFADFLGVLHFVEKITYFKVNTERNQKMLFSKNMSCEPRKRRPTRCRFPCRVDSAGPVSPTCNRFIRPSMTRKPQLWSYTIRVWSYETFIVSSSSSSG